MSSAKQVISNAFESSASDRLARFIAQQGLTGKDVIPLTPFVPRLHELYGVLRFEQLQHGHGPTAVGGLVGVFWRPMPWLVLRADYFVADRTLDDFEPGFRSAVSFMF